MATMLLYLTFALACVLMTRKLARRAFGAEPAFTLWLLPPLLALLPWLPAVPRVLAVTPHAWTLAGSASVLPQPMADALPLHWALWVWIGGSACCVLRLAVHYARLLQHSQPPSPAMLVKLHPLLRGLHASRLRMHAAGPAVLWSPRSLLLLPQDFLQRFDPEQQRLVLDHELTHLRRGDAWWNVFAELACALLWFHPLAWLALPRLRLDQELACDASMLRKFPREEARYAHALLQSNGVAMSPALIPWLAEPQLKERLHMIIRPRPGPLRRRCGFIGLAAMMAGGAFVVHSATPPSAPHDAPTDLTFNSRTAPDYPWDALNNHEQGTVVLDVLVGTDGKPLSTTVHGTPDLAPSLIAAASKAAMGWHFNPAIRDGQAVQSHARVPVSFALATPAMAASATTKMPISARTDNTRVPPPPPPPPSPAFPPVPVPSAAPPPPPPPPIAPTRPLSNPTMPAPPSTSSTI